MRTLLTLIANATALAFLSGAAYGQTPIESIATPSVPPELQAPAGHTAYMKGQATGTQNYICLPISTGAAWKFVGPQATLFFTYRFLHTNIRQQIMAHYLSSNPEESDLARPTWQSSLDSSSIWGKAIASSSDPKYVAAGAIPWLLVEVTGRQRGPMDGSMLTPTTYIQRLNTTGGIAPSSGCSEPADIGKLVLAPYTTDYYFYQATRRK